MCQSVGAIFPGFITEVIQNALNNSNECLSRHIRVSSSQISAGIIWLPVYFPEPREHTAGFHLSQTSPNQILTARLWIVPDRIDRQ